MRLGECDATGRPRPLPVDGSDHVIPCDTAVVAIGTRANPLFTSACPELRLTSDGHVATDPDGMTNVPGVFAGGEIVRGSATVILAIRDGKRAADAIDRYLASNGSTSPGSA